MAKLPRKKTPNKFFEALSFTGRHNSFPNDATSIPWPTTPESARRLYRAILRSTKENILPMIAAFASDAAGTTKKASRLITGQKARRLYLSLVAIGAIAGGALALLVASSTYAFYASDISNPTALLNKKNTGTTILDRNGKVLYQVYGANNRKVIEIEQMPESLIKATLAAEDPDFYDHPGFSWQGTMRAIYEDITTRSKAQGGSTITQQLVKNALLTSDKSYTRKYQELLLSTELERRYSKDQIMQMYLNEVYYGQGSYGVESAAQTYFKKPVSDLTLGESALIAGLPLGPSRFDPNLDIESGTARRDFILSRMAELGYISAAEAETAKAEPLQTYARQITIKAPHFVFYVLAQLRRDYGEDLVEKGGITVTTTLDLDKQAIGEAAVKNQVAKLKANNASNSGLVALDPKTGDILTMVGSVDYYQPQFGSVNITTAQLQPGSSFKPIAYAAAFEKGAKDGWNGSKLVEDKPLSLPNGDGTVYAPQNYDRTFRGNVTLRRALANSLNIPAVEVLRYAGIDSTIDMAHRLGITSLNERSRYGLSLVLGGGEVRPLDMAAVYATFANGGVKTTPRSVLKVTDRNENEITKKPISDKKEQVLDPRLAFMLTHILSDNRARTEEFGADSPLKLTTQAGNPRAREIPAAVKTGTTNDFRDNWTVGYTPDLVAAVWVGNNDHSMMNNVTGITGAAPIWNDYMSNSLSGQPIKTFEAPAGVVLQRVCSDGGLAPSGQASYEEVFLSEYLPTRRCAVQINRPKPKPEEKKEEKKEEKQTENDPGVGGAELPPPAQKPEKEEEEEVPAR